MSRYIYIATLVVVLLFYTGCVDARGNTRIIVTTDDWWAQYKAGVVDVCVDEGIAQSVQHGIALTASMMHDLARHCIIKADTLLKDRFVPNSHEIPMPTPMQFEPAGPT